MTSIPEAKSLIVGEEGSTLRLGIFRVGRGDLNIELVRGSVSAPPAGGAAGGGAPPASKDPGTWSVKELKQALSEAGVNTLGASEKSELIKLARDNNVPPPGTKKQQSSGGGTHRAPFSQHRMRVHARIQSILSSSVICTLLSSSLRCTVRDTLLLQAAADFLAWAVVPGDLGGPAQEAHPLQRLGCRSLQVTRTTMTFSEWKRPHLRATSRKPTTRRLASGTPIRIPTIQRRSTSSRPSQR